MKGQNTRDSCSILTKEALTAKCGPSVKKLYNHVRELTGTSKDNPMPVDKTDEQLHEDFADFFFNKIQKIRNSLSWVSKVHTN